METRRQLLCHVPEGPLGIVIDYLTTKSRDPFEKGRAGEYEACLSFRDTESATAAFNGAALSGFVDIMKLMVPFGIQRPKKNAFFNAACKSGCIEALEIAKKELWNDVEEWEIGFICEVEADGFGFALEAGHVHIAKKIWSDCNDETKSVIEANRFATLLKIYERDDKLAAEYWETLFQSSETSDFVDYDSFRACQSGDLQRVKAMLGNHVLHPKNCFEIACLSGNKDLIELLWPCMSLKTSTILDVMLKVCAIGYVECLQVLLKCAETCREDLVWVHESLIVNIDDMHFDCAEFLLRHLEHLDHEHCIVTSYQKQNAPLFAYLLAQTNVYILRMGGITIGLHHCNMELTNLLVGYLRGVDKLTWINIHASLIYAASSYHCDNDQMVALLLELAVELDACELWESLTIAFYSACRQGDLATVKILLQFQKARPRLCVDFAVRRVVSCVLGSKKYQHHQHVIAFLRGFWTDLIFPRKQARRMSNVASLRKRPKLK